MGKESIIEKVRKALALAADNPNDNEAQNAMLLAQKLMAKHQLEMSEVEISVNNTKEVKDDTAFSKSSLQWWIKQLAVIIGDNFRCNPYIGGGKTKTINFIGLKEDVEICKSVYQYAIKVIDHNVNQYMKDLRKQGFPTKGVRNDWIIGFMNGLRDKFKEQIEKEDWGLVLVKDDAVVEYTKNMKLRSGGRSKAVNTGGNNMAREAGYTTGKNFNSSAPTGEISQ